MPLYTVKTLIIIFLPPLISSCNGQEYKNDARNTSLQTQIGTQNSIFDNKQSKEQISQVVRMMFQDSKGNIWFGAEGGAFRLSNNSLIYIDSIKSESGKRVTIKDITEDKDGTIWLGHTDGISSVDGEKVTNYYESDGLISNDVWCISSDVEGNIWIGTIEGVCVYDRKKFVTFVLPEGIRDTTVGVSSTKMVQGILKDSKGVMWFSTNAGLFSYTNNRLENVSAKVGIPTNFVGKITEDKSGAFWVPTSVGLFYLKGDTLTNTTEKHFDESKGIWSIVVDYKGDIWFNCRRSIYRLRDEKITEYRIEEGNYGPLTFQIYEDKKSRLWFVGYGGAYRLENEKFLNITKEGPW